MSNNDKYIGNELTVFERAVNWKKYYGTFLKPYLTGRVLEVGAGLGGTTLHLCDGSQSEWMCLEPDPDLSRTIKKQIDEKSLPECCTCKTGTLNDIPSENLFDSIIYIDVIEHIENDKTELEAASGYLRDNGILMIVVPAHQYLYSPFDKAIGHIRRYTRKQLLSIIPPCLEIIKAIYLDSAGLSLSLLNKIFLKQSYPTEKQIIFWDRVIIRISKIIDSLFLYNFGKSILIIAKKSKSVEKF